MERDAASAQHALTRSRAVPGAALLVREAPLVLAVGVYVALVASLLPQMIVQDSWLTLVMGREIFQHGLPHTETITVWAHGDHWTDQQWFAQYVFYALERLGGLKLVMLAHGLLLSAAFACTLAAARARGASHRSSLLVASLGCVLAPWALQMRAQSFAPLLFVGLLWLLVSDSQAPSRRVLLVLPLLVLWANIHGTVLLGAREARAMLDVVKGRHRAHHRARRGPDRGKLSGGIERPSSSFARLRAEGLEPASPLG